MKDKTMARELTELSQCPVTRRCAKAADDFYTPSANGLVQTTNGMNLDPQISRQIPPQRTKTEEEDSMKVYFARPLNVAV